MYIVTYTFTLGADKTYEDLEPSLLLYKDLLEQRFGTIRDSMKIFQPLGSSKVICQFKVFECVFDNNFLLNITGLREIAKRFHEIITSFGLKVTAPKRQQAA